MVRKARIADARSISSLIEHYARRGLLLPRPLGKIYESLRTFVVWEDAGRVLGCGRLEIVWEDLAEVGSLAVDESARGRGAGSAMVQALVEDARELGIPRLFALTYQVPFFERLGFHVVCKQELPQKIWRDCLGCAKYDRCDEVAVLRVFDEVRAEVSSVAPTAADFGLSGFTRMPRPAPDHSVDFPAGPAAAPAPGSAAPHPSGLGLRTGGSGRLPVLR